MTLPPPPLSEVVRINQIGAGLTRALKPDEAVRARIARLLDLAELSVFEAELTIRPQSPGWRLEGRVVADAVQTCGVTLEPLPVHVDRRVGLDLVEAKDDGETELDLDIEVDADGPDQIEDGAVDLGVYAVEQLALSLDPFPRKPGAVFVPPEQPAEVSPFAVLRQLKTDADPKKG